MSRRGSYLGGGGYIDINRTLESMRSEKDKQEEMNVLRNWIQLAIAGTAPKQIPLSISDRLKAKLIKAGGYREWVQAHSKYMVIHDEIVKAVCDDFLLRCIRSKMEKRPYPDIPKSSTRLKKEIKQNGSVEEWMRMHPEYHKKKNSERYRKSKEKSEKTKRTKLQKQETTFKKAKMTPDKNEIEYLKDVIWAQLTGKETPSKVPKGLRKKYPTEGDLLSWVSTHPCYKKEFANLSARNKRRLARLETKKTTELMCQKKDVFKEIE